MATADALPMLHRRAARDTAGGLPPPPSSRPRSKNSKNSNSNNTIFLGSQIGDPDVISYSYTDEPWRLLAFDLWYFCRFARALPWIVLPLRPWDSAGLDELCPTGKNLFCLGLHALLLVLQLGFLAALPFAVVLPVWLAGLGTVGFLFLNWFLCLMLNGAGIEFHSDPEFAEARPEHAHEQWIFINGVAAGEHWMKNNLNRLALTFKRPVLGIHNRTSGIVFDVFECLIQRNLTLATGDVRACYRLLKDKLYNPQYSKIIFILHSQGGIEGGLVLDWLLQELPQDLLAKIEVYTFGNAANHFNNPHRHAASQRLVRENPLAAMATATVETTESPVAVASSPVSRRSSSGGHHPQSISFAASGFGSGSGPGPGSGSSKLPPLRTDSSTLSSIVTHTSSAAGDRALGHVEHYAHTTDFVAIWGILHFVRRVAATHTIPRFIGRVFVRTSDRGGHQFCQHYLDGMFPLARDPDTGRLTGAAEENEFMESEIEIGEPGSEMETVREAFEISFLGNPGGAAAAAARVYGVRGGRRRSRGVVRVKDFSRLWMYRNGGAPVEPPPLLLMEHGFARNATM